MLDTEYNSSLTIFCHSRTPIKILTKIDGGADNVLRNLVFEFKVGQEDYSGAAR